MSKPMLRSRKFSLLKQSRKSEPTRTSHSSAVGLPSGPVVRCHVSVLLSFIQFDRLHNGPSSWKYHHNEGWDHHLDPHWRIISRQITESARRPVSLAARKKEKNRPGRDICTRLPSAGDSAPLLLVVARCSVICRRQRSETEGEREEPIVFRWIIIF